MNYLIFCIILFSQHVLADDLNDKIKDFILNNPKVIIQSLQNFEQEKENEIKSDNKKKIKSLSSKIFDQNSLVEGNLNSNKTIVEFFDYNCSYCKKAHLDIKKILNKSGDYKIIYKNFPILSENSIKLAKYAVAISEIDNKKFIKFHNYVLKIKGQINDATLSSLINELELDESQIKESINNENINKKIKEDYDLANNLGLRGTPAFIIGDEIIFGYINYDEMLAKLNQQ